MSQERLSQRHLLGLEHNWTEEAKLTVTFPNDVNDPGLGLLSKRPAGARAAMQWSVRLLLEGDAAVAQLRQFVAAHRARAVGFYALNPVLDTDATSITAGTGHIRGTGLIGIDFGRFDAGLPLLQRCGLCAGPEHCSGSGAEASGA